MMTKSGSVRYSDAARILSQNSSVGITCLPAMCPHFLGATWSSMWRPATPAFSYSRTVRTTLSTLPYPVSASATTGSETHEARWPAWLAISVRVARPRSGWPRWEAAVPAPVMYTAWKPAASIRRAENPS